jgi:tetratricopeptide (TPR) repeat protein
MEGGGNKPQADNVEKIPAEGSIPPTDALKEIKKCLAQSNLPDVVRLMCETMAGVQPKNDRVLIINMVILFIHSYSVEQNRDLFEELFVYFKEIVSHESEEFSHLSLGDEFSIMLPPAHESFEFNEIPDSSIDDIMNPVPDELGEDLYYGQHNDAMCVLAYLMYKTGLFDQQRQLLDLVLASDPESTFGNWMAGVYSHYIDHNFDSAVQHYSIAIRNGLPYAYYSLAVMLHDVGEILHAGMLYKQCLLMCPYHPFALVNISQNSSDEKKQEVYEFIITNHPLIIPVQRNLVVMLLDQTRISTAAAAAANEPIGEDVIVKQRRIIAMLEYINTHKPRDDFILGTLAITYTRLNSNPVRAAICAMEAQRYSAIENLQGTYNEMTTALRARLTPEQLAILDASSDA